MTDSTRSMDDSRRLFLRGAGHSAALLALVGGGLLRPTRVLAAPWNKAAFDAKKLSDLWHSLGASAAPSESKDIVLKAPDIAENAAVVPLEVVSSIPDTREIMILVDQNPSLLTLAFSFGPGVEPRLSARIKMGKSSIVRAVVKTADGKLFQASRDVKVTIGGCG